ncbi:MAG: V-type ATPase subunit, partial [Oscillibacter sp.]|nr:V-type ATPase subunit [Oscillibacter sp.]
MAKKIKDTDYLVISARIKAMETGLLTRERMEQVLEARTDEEALKILQDCGYPELDAADPEAMDAALAQAREETLSDLAGGAPDPRYIDVFKLKYDYHNVKAFLKAEAMETDPSG